MSIQVTIDTTSKAEGELLAAALPGSPRASSWRSHGAIRLRCRSKAEVQELLETVERAARQSGLRWVRARFGDEERMFRSAPQHAA